MAAIPFNEITAGGTVRTTVMDNVLVLCIRDLIMHISGKNTKRANETWERLSDEQKKEIATDENGIINQLFHFQFPGKGQSKTPVATIEACMKLIMMLPGKRAKAMRLQAADILSGYINGKESLVEEIKTNKMIGPVAACSKLAQKAEAKAGAEIPQVSYVYGTKSYAFPNLVKIGRSSDVAARLTSLNTGCAPAPHFIVAVAPTYNAPRDEAWAHAFFSSARREGEFFEVTPEEVRAFFANHIMTQYQLELSEVISSAQGECLAQ